jgi:hypothetical protein
VAHPSAIHRALPSPLVHHTPTPFREAPFITANDNEQCTTHTGPVSRHFLRLAPGRLARLHRLQQRAKATRQEEGAADVPDLVCDVKRVRCDGVFFIIQLADKPLIENPLFLDPRKLRVNAVKGAVEPALL